MSCLWGQDKGGDIIRENKGLIIFPVKYEKELVFPVLGGDPSKRFAGKPSDPFQFVLQQQPCIDRNFQLTMPLYY